MRRRMAEQPRVVVAQALILVAVLAGAVYLGAQLAGGGDGKSPTQAEELDRAREALRLQRSDTREARRDGERVRARIGSQRRRTARLERRTRTLKRGLNRARRRLARRRAR